MSDRPPQVETVFYDGGCGLCHGAVRFLLTRDHAATLRFAPLHGPTFTAALASQPAPLAELPDSVIVQLSDGSLHWKTASVRLLLRQLGGGWRALGWLLRLVPLPLADLGYDAVARVRHRLFARPKTTCPMLPPELRGRFLP